MLDERHDSLSWKDFAGDAEEACELLHLAAADHFVFEADVEVSDHSEYCSRCLEQFVVLQILRCCHFVLVELVAYWRTEWCMGNCVVELVDREYRWKLVWNKQDSVDLERGVVVDLVARMQFSWDLGQVETCSQAEVSRGGQ